MTQSISINDILPGNEEEFYRILSDAISAGIRVSMPGIVQSFSATEQTVTVQLSVRERVRNPDLSYSWVAIPVLVDVPIVIPRAGGFCLTLPVQAGDECLVVFGDVCMDSWWDLGGVQNQPAKRRHDLSDGYAILGVWSQPRVITGYSTTAAQLRSDSGAAYISLTDTAIELVAGTITANGTVIG
jgi:hypothetical protein